MRIYEVREYYDDGPNDIGESNHINLPISTISSFI